MVILIGLYGTMFGILAHWRGSVRPGIIAHAWLIERSACRFIEAIESAWCQ
jgi:hypothetical protein